MDKSPFKQKIMAAAALWPGHPASERLTPILTRLVDEVEVCIGALKLRQHHDEDCLDATEKFKPSEMCECGASVVKQVLEAHQKRWEDLK